MVELPPPDSAAEGPPAEDYELYTATGDVTRVEDDSGSFVKVAFNLIAALGFATLAGWLLVADLQYPGDLMFQLSWSLPALAIYLTFFGAAALILAIFPKRIIFFSQLLLIFRGAVGFPVNIWTDNTTAAIALSVAIFALASYYLVGSITRFHRIAHRPWLCGRHSLAIVGIGLLLTTIAIPCTLLGYTNAGRNLMGDYVRISLRSLSLVERVFQRDDQRVYLVGMMHIGSGTYYDSIQERLSAPLPGDTVRRLVLTEGVSDQQRVLPESFTSGATYARWAGILGLEVQESFHNAGFGSDVATDHTSRDKRILFRNADIDVSELDPEYQDTLISLLSLLDETDPFKLMVAQPEGVTGPDIEDLFFEALIGDRNDALMDEFNKTAPDYQEIYIPWGAAHLTDVEERLLEQGYTQVEEIVRPIISW